MKNKLLCLMLALLLAMFSLPAAAETDVYDRSADGGALTVRFLSLDTTNGDKSGDATLLVSPDGKVMLIDAGEPTASSMLVDTLTRLGIDKIDYLVASHPHIDHVGGMPAVLAAFPVAEAMTSYVDYGTATNQAFLSALDAQNVPLSRLSMGDSFSFGESVRVDVLWPSSQIDYPAGYPEGATQFINNHSLVLRFTFGDSSFLFSGDLYLSGEKEVIAAADPAMLDVDVIKINHHAADTSSCKSWRSAVSAKYAVGECNGIESLTVCQKFIKEGTELYHTFVDGIVLIRTKGDGSYEVLTEKTRRSEF